MQDWADARWGNILKKHAYDLEPTKAYRKLSHSPDVGNCILIDSNRQYLYLEIKIKYSSASKQWPFYIRMVWEN